MMLPEFDEGGVERHVLLLAQGLARNGHSLVIVSAGGALEKLLPKEIAHIRLPIHKKNPLVAIACALRLAALHKTYKWEIIHAHSRVPDWIAWLLSSLTSLPWIATAHARYSKNYGVRPLRHACAVICVSHAVKHHLHSLLPTNAPVIYNALAGDALPRAASSPPPFRLLYVGRLTRLKGLGVLIDSLSRVKGEWVLDVVGDGPQREEFERLVNEHSLSEKILFHGFRDDVEVWLAHAHLFLFPSLDEGMGLVLMQALRANVPVLASNIPAVRELLSTEERLLPPADVNEWADALQKIIQGQQPPEYTVSLPTLENMIAETEKIYQQNLTKKM